MSNKEFKIGDYVKYGRKWLQSAGVYTGNLPRGVGQIIDIEALGNGTNLVVIQWNFEDIPKRVNTKNLIHVGDIEAV
jgi:hypothetical protein